MIDINKPVTNPVLVLAIQRMREDDSPDTRNQLAQEVIRAHFLCPVEISPSPEPHDGTGSFTMEAGTVLRFPLINMPETQEQYYFGFTDWDELRKWKKDENQQTMVFTFDDYAAMVFKDNGASGGLIINPFGESFLLSVDMILSLLHQKGEGEKRGLVTHVVEKQTTAILSEPREYPSALVQAISDCLRGHKNVNAAYLKLMEKEGETSYLLIVDFQGNKDKLFPYIAQAADNYLGDMYLDIMAYDDKFGRVARNTKPIFQKKRFGIF